MGWSGGTFSRVHDWTTDEGSAIDIEADRMDEEDDNFAAGINACIHKGGTNTPTANLPMGGYRHTGVDDAAALTDYASAKDVINQSLVYYVDSGSANQVTLTPSPAITAYAAGQRFVFKAAATNTGNTDININALGNKNLLDLAGEELAPSALAQNSFYEILYNGSSFILLTPMVRTSSFTPTHTGFSSPPTDDVDYTIFGNIVIAQLKFAGGTSNSTSWTITNVPSEIQTTSSQTVYIPVAVNNGIDIEGCCLKTGTGAVWTFYPGHDDGTATWTSVNNKGLPTGGNVIVYAKNL